MKKIILIAVAALLAAPAIAQEAADDVAAAAVLQDSPEPDSFSVEATDAEIAIDQAVAAGTKTTATDEGHTWGALEDTDRFLLIMGTADGFTSVGDGGPCFPGKDNTQLAKELSHAGFDKEDPANLAPALADLSADEVSCQGSTRRGYDASLLKNMPDDHLALYLTGAVRGYAHLQECPSANHGYAAASATAALFTAEDSDQPSDVLANAFAEGCQGIPNES